MNPFELSEDELIGLWANMPRLQAKRTRETAMLTGARLTAEAIYDLTLAETGSEAQASKAMSDAIAAKLRNNETPE